MILTYELDPRRSYSFDGMEGLAPSSYTLFVQA